MNFHDDQADFQSDRLSRFAKSFGIDEFADDELRIAGTNQVFCTTTGLTNNECGASDNQNYYTSGTSTTTTTSYLTMFPFCLYFIGAVISMVCILYFSHHHLIAYLKTVRTFSTKAKQGRQETSNNAKYIPNVKRSTSNNINKHSFATEVVENLNHVGQQNLSKTAGYSDFCSEVDSDPPELVDEMVYMKKNRSITAPIQEHNQPTSVYANTEQYRQEVSNAGYIPHVAKPTSAHLNKHTIAEPVLGKLNHVEQQKLSQSAFNANGSKVGNHVDETITVSSQGTNQRAIVYANSPSDEFNMNDVVCGVLNKMAMIERVSKEAGMPLSEDTIKNLAKYAHGTSIQIQENRRRESLQYYQQNQWNNIKLQQKEIHHREKMDAMKQDKDWVSKIETARNHCFSSLSGSIWYSIIGPFALHVTCRIQEISHFWNNASYTEILCTGTPMPTVVLSQQSDSWWEYIFGWTSGSVYSAAGYMFGEYMTECVSYNIYRAVFIAIFGMICYIVSFIVPKSIVPIGAIVTTSPLVYFIWSNNFFPIMLLQTIISSVACISFFVSIYIQIQYFSIRNRFLSTEAVKAVDVNKAMFLLNDIAWLIKIIPFAISLCSFCAEHFDAPEFR